MIYISDLKILVVLRITKNNLILDLLQNRNFRHIFCFMVNRRQHAAKGIPPFLIKETPTLGVFLFLLKRVKAIFTTKGFL